MQNNFSTIHVFAYGEAQIIGENINFKAPISSFTKLQPVIDEIKSKKPNDVVDGDFHVIHIFNGVDVRYLSADRKVKANFSFKFIELNTQKITDLYDEFIALKNASNPSV